MHDLGPEIRRAISGNLEEEDFPERDIEEPMHRVSTSSSFFDQPNVLINKMTVNVADKNNFYVCLCVNPFRLEAPKYAHKFNTPYTKEAAEYICNTGTVFQYTVLTFVT